MLNHGPTHPKMLALMRTLAVPHYAAVGVMELIWQFTARYAPRGDIGRYANIDIAESIQWPIGDHDRLINALVEVRYLDQVEKHRLVVHNWARRCDNTVHRKVAMAGEYFVDGSRPNLVRVHKDKKPELMKYYDDLDRKKGKRGTVLLPAHNTELFWERFWDLYPRKKNRIRAKQAWVELNLVEADARHIVAALESWLINEMFGPDPKRIPYAQNWLKEKRYEEGIEAKAPDPNAITEREITPEDLDILLKGGQRGQH